MDSKGEDCIKAHSSCGRKSLKDTCLSHFQDNLDRAFSCVVSSIAMNEGQEFTASCL